MIPPGRSRATRVAGAAPRRPGLGFGSVVHINEKGGRFGGTEEYLALLTEELTARGVRSHLVCGAASGSLPAGFASVEVVEGLADREATPGAADDVVDLVRRLAPDVVYLHNIFDAGVVRGLAAMPGRPTLVWYVHDHYLTCLSELRWRRDIGVCPVRLGPGCLDSIAERRCVLRFADQPPDPADLERRTALSATLVEVDAVVVVSDYMRSLLVEAHPDAARQIHLVPRPVRVRRRRVSHRRRGDAEPLVVTFAGRITPEKGLAVLIEALGVVDCPAPVELRIAGVTEHAVHHADCIALARQAERANPALRVRWLGHLDYAAVDALLAASDVVAVPSQWPEPLGAVALEAMAMGTAVIASDVGGLRTHLVSGRNCLLTVPGSVGGWAAELGHLLRRPDEAARLGAQARADVAGLTARAHVEVLDAIIRQARPAGPVRR